MKALKKYLKKRKSAINLLLEKKQGSFTTDTFHTLRVEIKKLNALFDLAHFCFKNFKQKKTFKPFELIFDQAGKIREIQVEEALFEDHFTSKFVKHYRNDLKKLLTEELNDFFTIIKPSFAEKLRKKYSKINSLLVKTTKKKTNRYMDKKRADVEKLLYKKTLKKKQIHGLRKKLKEYQFNKQSLKYTKKNSLMSMKTTMTDLLGEWHDYQTVIQHLKKARDSGEINSKESGQLNNVITTFTFKNNQLFNKINTTLPNTFLKNSRNN